MGEALTGLSNRLRSVIAAYDNGDVGPGDVGYHRRLDKRLTDHGQGGLGFPVPPGQAKIPILNVMTAPVSFIGPGKDEGAGAAHRKRGVNLPI